MGPQKLKVFLDNFIDMRPEVKSPFLSKKKTYLFLQKHVFSTKNGLINSDFMSIKQLNKERQPLKS